MLPKEIGELSRLKELHIQSNRLTVLPPELGMMPRYNHVLIWSVVPHCSLACRL